MDARIYRVGKIEHPEWLLWGKAQPREAEASPEWHPLICHMLDVASVAEALWERLPAATQKVLSSPFQCPSSALAWLRLVVALHDAGKALPEFQAKWPGLYELQAQAGLTGCAEERYHHGVSGAVLLGKWLQDEHLFCEAKLPSKLATPVARAVAAHHGEFASHADTRIFKCEQWPLFQRGSWAKCHRRLVHTLIKALQVRGELGPWKDEALAPGFVVALAGFTAVADWLGSDAEVFKYQPLPVCVEGYQAAARERAAAVLDKAGWRAARPGRGRSFTELFPPHGPRPLQETAARAVADLKGPSLLLIEAAMGEGKTEAALLAADHLSQRAGQAGLYVGLPTQATSNQMLQRVRRFLERTEVDPVNLHLVHGDAALSEEYEKLKIRAIYDRPKENERHAATPSRVAAEQWFCRSKRSLLATHAVGTIDQSLLGVLRVRHGFVRLFGLAGKTVVLDEIHAYDTYTSELLDRLVAWLGCLGTTVILLSATLPKVRRQALLRAYGAEPNAAEADYPRITAAQRGGSVVSLGAASLPESRKTVTLHRQVDNLPETARRLVAAVERGGCVAWLCNTVGRAQEAYQLVQQLLRERTAAGERVELHLLHSRMLRKDRQRVEQEIGRLYGPQPAEGGEPSREPGRPARGIVVGTQVLEQSLDLDFDRMVTDLAPIDLVLQRAGRLHRHKRPRPSKHKEPVLSLVMPEVVEGIPDFSTVASVYDTAVVLRTWLALGGTTELRIPADLERWVERVYPGPGSAPTAQPSDEKLRVALAKAESAAKQARALASQEAKAQLLFDPAACPEDDEFGSVDFVEGEGAQVHEHFRAATRLADPAVDVVCLWRQQEGWSFDAAGKQPAALVPEGWREVRKLLLHSVKLKLRDLVKLKENEIAYQPKPWRGNAALHFKWLLELGPEAAEAGASLDPDLGMLLDL